MQESIPRQQSILEFLKHLGIVSSTFKAAFGVAIKTSESRSLHLTALQLAVGDKIVPLHKFASTISGLYQYVKHRYKQYLHLICPLLDTKCSVSNTHTSIILELHLKEYFEREIGLQCIDGFGKNILSKCYNKNVL